MLENQKAINYQIIGEDTSPKLVFLHGIMGQGRNWLSIAKKFSKDYQCLVYDQRGHGRSFHPKQGFHLEDYAGDLKELLKNIGWVEPVSLIGHSMGGRVALYFTHHNPELVKSLVVVDIGPVSDWQSMSEILEKLDFVPVPFASKIEARAFLEGQFLEKYPNKMLMEFFYSNIIEQSGQYDWTFSKLLVRKTLELARYKDYWEEFKCLKVPTLLLRGGLSTDLRAEDFNKVLANNSNIEGREVAGAGHWVHAEKPLETIKIIEDFFNIAGASKQC